MSDHGAILPYLWVEGKVKGIGDRYEVLGVGMIGCHCDPPVGGEAIFIKVNKIATLTLAMTSKLPFLNAIVDNLTLDARISFPG